MTRPAARREAYRGWDWERLGGCRCGRIGPFDYTNSREVFIHGIHIYGMEENVDIGKSTRDARTIPT